MKKNKFRAVFKLHGDTTVIDAPSMESLRVLVFGRGYAPQESDVIYYTLD